MLYLGKMGNYVPPKITLEARYSIVIDKKEDIFFVLLRPQLLEIPVDTDIVLGQYYCLIDKRKEQLQP